MKHVLYVFCFILIKFTGFSQSTSLGSLTVSTKEIDSQDSIQITVSFQIKKSDSLKEIELVCGEKDGSGDMAVMTLEFMVREGEKYLRYNERLFPIVNDSVTLDIVVPRESVMKKYYLNVSAKDSNGKELSKIKN